MQFKKLLAVFVTGAVFPFALLGCPDKAAETKPDPAAAAKPATPAPAASAAAAPATNGGGW